MTANWGISTNIQERPMHLINALARLVVILERHPLGTVAVVALASLLVALLALWRH